MLDSINLPFYAVYQEDSEGTTVVGAHKMQFSLSSAQQKKLLAKGF